MNPTNANSLDPKLKEVYDRVMGTSMTPPMQRQTTPSPSGTSQALPVTSTSQPTTAAATTDTQKISPTTPISPPPPPRPAAVSGTPAPQSAVDYAALAAKYATPPVPSFSSPSNQPQPEPVKAASVTPSTTTYGVVNAGADTKKEKVAPIPAEKGSNLKKIMLILGILMFLMIYTFVWIVVFGVELPF